MAPKKIVVFGVTGVQGGSVARALLQNPGEYEVWGVTRSKSSAKAKAVAELGVTLIEGDLDDPSSYEAGLKGADNVFVNADFWQFYKGDNPQEALEHEVKQNTGAIDAAVRQGVPHIVFSTLQDFMPKFHIPHCDSKVEVVKYLKKNNISHACVNAVWYFTNVLIFPQEKVGDKTVVTFPFPDDQMMTGFASEQIGHWAKLAFDDPEKWEGKHIYCCGECITPAKMAKELSAHTGRNIETAHMTREQFYSDEFKKTLPTELYLNYLAILDGQQPSPEMTANSKALFPGQWDFKQWLEHTPKVMEVYGK